jgi:putative acetyltransferase
VSTVITQEQPDSPDATALIMELDDILQANYPPESRHGYSIDKLLAEGIAFFVLRSDGIPAACGGIKRIGGEYGELKRMYVRPQFRGKGFGKQMVAYLTDYCHKQGLPLARLETGIYQQEAIKLYEGMGFRRIPPFGSYTDDPVSLCYEKTL